MDSNGRKTGYWKIYGKMKKLPDYKPDQVVEEGFYKSSRKIGTWKRYWANGIINNEIEYQNGRPNGKYITYYESGQVEEIGNFPAWRLNGETWRYYESGCLEKYSFNDTHSIKTNTYYYDDCDTSSSSKGTIQKPSDTTYKPRNNSTWDWRGSYKPVEKITYWDSTGINILYQTIPADTTKKIQPPKFYKDGYHKVYNDNADLWLDGEFRAGRLYNGKYYVYDSNGLLDHIEIYKSGKYFANGVLR